MQNAMKTRAAIVNHLMEIPKQSEQRFEGILVNALFNSANENRGSWRIVSLHGDGQSAVEA